MSSFANSLIITKTSFQREQGQKEIPLNVKFPCPCFAYHLRICEIMQSVRRTRSLLFQQRP